MLRFCAMGLRIKHSNRALSRKHMPEVTRVSVVCRGLRRKPMPKVQALAGA
jgi:hypothetical protein